MARAGGRLAVVGGVVRAPPGSALPGAGDAFVVPAAVITVQRVAPVDVPRTATATAATDVELLAVSRDEFLTSVTGHARSFGTATGMADRRLADG